MSFLTIQHGSEIWVKFAEKTGIEDFKLTTRDISDYDVLMKKRLELLNSNGFKIFNVQEVIKEINPFQGACDFLDRLRENFQVIILSDTFYEFSQPIMKKLGWPTIFCHKLECNDSGEVINYHLRQIDAKKEAIKSLHRLNYKVISAGDSYNDISMLNESDRGILYNPPSSLADSYPEFKIVYDYDELFDLVMNYSRERF